MDNNHIVFLRQPASVRPRAKNKLLWQLEVPVCADYLKTSVILDLRSHNWTYIFN